KRSRPFAPYPLKALSYGVFGVIFFGLPASAFASQTLDALVSAAAGFSSAIQQQLEVVQTNPSPAIAQLQKLRRTTCPFTNLPEKTGGRLGLGIPPAVILRRCLRVLRSPPWAIWVTAAA